METIVKYRRWLGEFMGQFWIESATQRANFDVVKDVETEYDTFVRWIDTEWQEYEV
jgi:hypothetical protein